MSFVGGQKDCAVFILSAHLRKQRGEQGRNLYTRIYTGQKLAGYDLEQG